MNRKFSLFFIVAVSLAVCVKAGLAEQKNHMGANAHGMAMAAESSHADVKKHQACAHCGMDREKFAYSRMLITYSEGASAGVCSIHCAVTELKANKEKVIKSIEVADLNTKKLVATEKAFWVIGGSKKGVMTVNPKWAFAKKDDAELFIKKNGGKLVTYKEALAQAEKE